MTSRLWKLALSQSGLFSLTLFAAFAGGFAMLAQAWLISSIINDVFLNHLLFEELITSFFFLFIAILLRALFKGFQEYASGKLALAIKSDLRTSLLQHIFNIGPIHLKAQHSGTLTTTGFEGIEALDAYFRRYLPQVLISLILPVSILFFVFPLDWISGLVLLLTAPLIPFFMILIGKMAEKRTAARWDLLNRLGTHYLDVLQGLKTLKLLGQSAQQIKNIKIYSHRYAQATMEVLRVAFLSALALELLATISTAMVAVQIGLRLMFGLMDFHQALFILVLAPEFYLPLRNLGTHFHDGMTGLQAAESIFRILDQPTSSGGELSVQDFSTISFKHVSFQYAERSHTLSDISFDLHKGERIAIVGASGAGKSTLIHLLLNFIQPTMGEISIDNTPLGLISSHDWYQQVSWLSQSPFLWHASVRENLLIANPNANEAQLWEALDNADSTEWIKSLSAGLETQIGDRGVLISGGQAQRIALARAYLKNAPLLLLDEPTASLDIFTEARITNSLNKLMRDRTSLVITHRLAPITSADRILLLHKGALIAFDTHNNLMRTQPQYQAMFRKQ